MGIWWVELLGAEACDVLCLGNQAFSLLAKVTMDGLRFKTLLPINEVEDRWYGNQAIFEFESREGVSEMVSSMVLGRIRADK